MSAIGNVALLLSLLIPSIATAEDAGEDDAPAIHQAAPNFSNAIAGAAFAVEWSATPTELSLDSPITVNLKITGATNPHRVRRPDLANHPGFRSRFRTVSNGNDSPAVRDAKSVTFTYQLQAREVTVAEIPAIEIVYFSPAGQKRGTKYLEAIPLTIRPASTAAAAPTPLVAPERFFQIPIESELQSRGWGVPNWRWWLGITIVFAAASCVWIAVWRRRYPDGVRLALLRRNRAVRRALEDLAAAKSGAEPAARTATALRNYLRERFGLPVVSSVPHDVEAAMRAGGFEEQRIRAVVEILRRCDAARFGGTSDNAVSVVGQARELVLGWENPS